MNATTRFALAIAICAGCPLGAEAAAPANAEPLKPAELIAARKKAAAKPRRIVFHSDGMSMNPDKRFLESNPCVFPFLPGSQTDACTYSLIHQFPVARLYRARVAQEWPPGIIEQLYGDGPDGLDAYLAFCGEHGYEAFWAMRTNDTHDAGDSEHGHRRWNSNRWKQAHPEYLMGQPYARLPYGKWSALDYARGEVREKVFRVLEEVCENYPIDGLVLDFFRHLPTFKTTVLGGDATAHEVEMMDGLIRRIRRMADHFGAARRRPILLAVRTPDSPGYSRAMGLDVERWMEEDLIDIWIAAGYFRLEPWEATVAVGHRHGVQVWASIDESRVDGRQDQNSPEAYRARIARAWDAGVDAVWLFNFFHLPGTPQFPLLAEAGDPATLARTDKMYVASARGQEDAHSYLKDAERFFARPTTFSPESPATLRRGQPERIEIKVADDVASAEADGYEVRATLLIQTTSPASENELAVRFNDRPLEGGVTVGDRIEHTLDPRLVRRSTNRIVITRGPQLAEDPVLRDLQLWIRYRRIE